MLPTRIEIQKRQTALANFAHAQGDWLTLVQLARQAHAQEQSPLWEQGLIDWAKEIILYQHTPAGAYHMEMYYHDSGQRLAENYWHDLGLEWERGRHSPRR